jgi:hypothetical protein
MEDIDKESLDALPIQEPEEEERSYSERELKLRDKFVKEYLKDYDALGAAMRVGYSRSIAKEYAVRFMDEPYVIRKIESQKTTPFDEMNEDQMHKMIKAGLYREANDRGMGSTQPARVAAWAHLARLSGMEPATRVKNEITGADGAPLAGTFVLPGLMTPEQWEQAAAQQQEDLVSGKIAQAKQVAPPSID